MTYKTIKVQDHAVHLLERLNKQRESKLFCDVVLKVEGKNFLAHRNVLSACSDYFRTMFSSNMREQYSKDIPMDGVTAAAVEQVLEYMYTEEVKLSLENVFGILEAASLMILPDLLEVISKYLTESISPSTCLFLRDVSKLFNLDSLQKKAEECIFENFEEVASQKKFCDLKKEDLALLMSSDDLKVPYESIVFDALVRWVNENRKQRKSLFPSLFKLVRLQHVPQEFLANRVRSEPLVKQFHECRDLVDDAFHFHLQPSMFKAQKSRNVREIFLLNQQGGVEKLAYTPDGLHVQQLTTPDVQLTETHAIARSGHVVYLCGRSSVNSSSVISFNGRSFKLEGNLTGDISSEATAFCIADCLYIVESTSASTVAIYQLRPSFTFVMTIDDELDLPRNASSVVVGGDAYIIGGIEPGVSGINESRTLSNWNGQQHSRNGAQSGNGYWEHFEQPLLQRSNAFFDADFVSSFLQTRSSASQQRRQGFAPVVTVPRRRNPGATISSVRVFNPATNTWTNKNDMNQARQRCGAAVLNSKIFVCGGLNQNGGCINSVEYMDVAQDVWTLVRSACTVNLGATSMCAFQKELYIVGMNNNVMWKYDTESESWSQDYRIKSNGYKIFTLF